MSTQAGAVIAQLEVVPVFVLGALVHHVAAVVAAVVLIHTQPNHDPRLRVA